MIIATHAIFGTYGFWLPNDPRGSWSTFVASWELFKYGEATTVSTRHSLAHRSHNSQLRYAAKSAMAHSPVRFSGVQARAVGRGFAKAVGDAGFAIYACSILPDHVHVVIGRHARAARNVVAHLKSMASKRLRMESLHPFQTDADAESELASPWVRGCWTVFLNSPVDVRRAIRYVENNPLKDGKRKQVWSFVRTYIE